MTRAVRRPAAHRPLRLVSVRLYEDNVEALQAQATQERPWQQRVRLIVDEALQTRTKKRGVIL
jgi:uncharacterized protein (DUF4415 family)